MNETSRDTVYVKEDEGQETTELLLEQETKGGRTMLDATRKPMMGMVVAGRSVRHIPLRRWGRLLAFTLFALAIPGSAVADHQTLHLIFDTDELPVPVDGTRPFSTTVLGTTVSVDGVKNPRVRVEVDAEGILLVQPVPGSPGENGCAVDHDPENGTFNLKIMASVAAGPTPVDLLFSYKQITPAGMETTNVLETTFMVPASVSGEEFELARLCF